MKLKSLLLASAAAVIAVSAQAADLPSDIEAIDAVPSPISVPDLSSDVGLCDAMGAGFFVLPGSETCLRIGGQIETGILYADIGDDDNVYGGIRARLDLDTHTDSAIGPVGSKLRIGLDTVFSSDHSNDANDTDVGVELAYITVGPAYVGFKETLFNTKFGYGDLFDADTFLGGLNTLTAGAMVEDLGGGFYVGGGVETAERGNWLAGYDRIEDLDFVARAGIAGQTWGGSDLSFLYRESDNSWGVKSTTDWAVLDGTDVRLTAAYANLNNVDVYYVGAGAQHGFNDQVTGFASAGYSFSGSTVLVPAGGVFLPVSFTDDAWLANAGVTYSPAENFDITGEVGYATADGEDAWLGQLKFTRSW